MTAVLVGAGDIAACGSAGTTATARLLDSIGGTVFTTGDNAYPSGTAESFRDCYHPTWGRHRGRTRPAPGNHEYEVAGAAPYFDYFGPNAGPPGAGFYSYRAGAWQVFSLNSNVDMSSVSAQALWLRNEVRMNPSPCSLAYWHHPLHTSGPHGSFPAAVDLWRTVYDAGVDVVLNGHEHLYERFAPQDAYGSIDPERGIRQFIVGSGGAELYRPGARAANSEFVSSEFGVLKLTLHATTYSWEFIGLDGRAHDSGSDVCH